MKIRRIIYYGLDLNKCYPRYAFEQHSRDFKRWSRNANVSGT